MVLSGNYEDQGTEDEFGLKKNSPNILKKLERKYIKPIFEKRMSKESKSQMEAKMENMGSKVN
jgi:hypothetical protein